MTQSKISRAIAFALYICCSINTTLFSQIRCNGTNDSTLFQVNANYKFVVGNQILYKNNVQTSTLSLIKDFSSLAITDTVYNQNIGNFIIDFAFTDTFNLWIVYGTSYRAGLYQSTDGGISWNERTDLYTYPNVLGVKRITAIKNYYNTLYLFQDYYNPHIHKSTDNGLTWSLLVYGATADYFDLGFCANGDIYAYSASVDGRGIHIVKVNEVTSPYYYTVDFTKNSIGIAYFGTAHYCNSWQICNQLLTDSICPFLTTAIQDISANNFFNVYPNPANKTLNVDIIATTNGYNTISLYDVFGKKIYTQILKTKNNSIITSEYKPGIYFLKIEDELGVNAVTKKILINHD